MRPHHYLPVNISADPHAGPVTDSAMRVSGDAVGAAKRGP